MGIGKVSKGGYESRSLVLYNYARSRRGRRTTEKRVTAQDISEEKLKKKS